MSEKELLYVEDMLGHLEYLKKHILISKDCLTEQEYEKFLDKLSKKIDALYASFYKLLGGE